MTDYQKYRLLREIARYGERAYRRGVQQAVELCVDKATASKLRYRSDQFVFEICDMPNRKFSLTKRPLLHRIRIESVGRAIRELMGESPIRRGNGWQS